MTTVELKKVTLPLMALVVPVTAFGGYWVARIDKDVRANRDELVQQQFEVNGDIASLDTRQAVMAQNIESIRATLERLEKKMDEE